MNSLPDGNDLRQWTTAQVKSKLGSAQRGGEELSFEKGSTTRSPRTACHHSRRSSLRRDVEQANLIGKMKGSAERLCLHPAAIDYFSADIIIDKCLRKQGYYCDMTIDHSS
jgi:hypothetical protein